MYERMIYMTSNYSFIDKYGDNFTNKEYVTNPAIGRDEEIKKLILILLTPDKSAILTGKPGIGKTAIVEGLAYKIINNDVVKKMQSYFEILCNPLSICIPFRNKKDKHQGTDQQKIGVIKIRHNVKC